MKRFLLLLLWCLSCTIAMAQTTWTGLGANTNWNTVDNWDTNAVPTASDDVIIPTGFTVTLNVAGNINSIDVQGTSTFEINSNLTFAEDSSFGVDTTINWSSGTLSSSVDTLTNNGVLNLIGSPIKIISGDTTLENFGTINITSSGDLWINGSGSVLNNPIGSIIDIQENSGNITWSGLPGVLNNSGLIKKTISAGEAQIVIPINNNDGTIQVESGILSFQNPTGKNFTDGTYNVFAGATMDWDTTINPSGSLEGTIAGELNWNNTVNVVDGTFAAFNFSAAENFNWTTGTLSGGGTLTNTNVLKLVGSPVKVISGDTTLENEGTLIITSSGDLWINGAGSVLNNPVGSTIEIQENSGNITWSGVPGVLNNAGMIKKTTSIGEAQIVIPINNNNGTIQVEEGTLSFQNPTGKNFTDGTYNVFAGATMDWDTTINPSGSLEGTIAGNLNWNNTVNVVDGTFAAFNFSAAENFNWTTGTLSGGGTLTNTNVLKLVGAPVKIISGDTTLENEGTLVITSSGDLWINGTGSVLNNPAGSTIEIQENSGNITWSGIAGVLNNAGMIKKTTSTGEAQIVIPINNNNGTIQVEEGTLSFQNPTGKNFTDGTYNVFAGATMDWDTAINPLGSLEGTIVGALNWNNIVNIPVGETAVFNFSEDDNFNWTTGTLSGGGTLTNTNVLKLVGAPVKIINGDTTLDNSGTINITSSGDLWITQGVVNNLESGIIDIQADSGSISWSGGTSHILNNAGLIKRTTTSGLAQILVELNNSGTIEVVSGELEHTGSLPFTNEDTGIVKGIGTFDLPTVANYTNNGTFAPGLSPGTLNVQGDFTSTGTSTLDIELNGLIPDTEHDVLAIAGNNNVFEGIVNVTMGFEGTIGDEFTVVTTSGTIATANLQSPIENVDFDGKRYTFDISYPDNNKVVLTITDKLDILPPNIITQDITVELDASGNASISPNQIDNGTTDNCTPTNELQFSLDIDTFTCADLGDNTVQLTVTDNDNNSASLPATVTVLDVTNPTVIAQDIVVELDAIGNASILASEIDNGSSDNCTVVDLALDISDFTCADLGDNTVELTVTDQSGNSDSDFATVTVVDAMNPLAVTQDIVVELDATGNASILPADINDGSSDNCMMATLSLDISDFTCSDLGDNTVELTVTDQSGNSDSAFATVTVIDAEGPTVVTQDIVIVLDATGNASIVPEDVNNGSSDNCMMGTLSLDITDFTCADLGDNTVNLSVTDQSGNSNSESATVTVEDNISPIITCPAAGGFTIIDAGDYTVPDYVGDAIVAVEDNCNFSVLQTPTPGTVLPDGDYNVTLIVTDDFGNESSCSFELKVRDTTLSINDVELSNRDVLLFPNPVTDRFTIKNNSRLDLMNLQIIDVAGKVIESIDLKGMQQSFVVPLDNYANGMYFVRINVANSSITKQIIKQ